MTLLKAAVPCAGPLAVWHPILLEGWRTGVLDIQLRNRRVLSVPSQLGCPVACSFCISRDTPLVRNLEASEMLALVACALEALPGDARPLELSFTGEGEPLLNWRNVAKTVDSCRRLDARFDRVRYSCSGVGALALLPRTHGAGLPVRLQVSLHSARQAARDHLVPRSTPLIDLEAALRQHQALFQRIELNVVLQDGINDSDADLQALGTWGDESWPILLNPLLSDGQERVAARTSDFENALRAAGRQVVRYERVASAISRGGLYRRLTASPRPESVRL